MIRMQCTTLVILPHVGCSFFCAFSLPEGDMGICGVTVLMSFYCGDAVNKISICGVAVILNPSVCDVCVFHSAVFGEMKLFAVLWFLVWSFSDLNLAGMLMSSILGSFSGRFVCHFHGLSYKRAFPVSTKVLRQMKTLKLCS